MMLVMYRKGSGGMASNERVVLVTGASSGIGKAAARQLAANGWRVFGAARRPEAVERSHGVEPIPLDVTDDDSVRAAVELVLRSTARIDGLVNNAGAALMGAVEETSPDQARALLDTNVVGVLRMSQAVLPAMREQGFGRIVNVSSVVGFLPAPYMAVYAASKHAVEGLSESMDHEVRGFGVRVLVVQPGFTRTNIDAASTPADRPHAAYETQRERVRANIGAQIATAPEPAEVARAIERALTAPAFKRMPVGSQARLLSGLRRTLPAGLVDRSIRRNFALDARPHHHAEVQR